MTSARCNTWRSRRICTRWPGRRRGVTRTDVVVVLFLVAITAMLVVMGMTRSRENARLTFCSRNLTRIGFAISLFDQMRGKLPATNVNPPDRPASIGPPGPLMVMLQALGLPDFTELTDPRTPPNGNGKNVPSERPVPGFTCPSDPDATNGFHAAPISYRAATGDSSLGDNGPFAPGRTWSLAAIEQRDGLAYTAAFSERLVGSGGAAPETLRSYRMAAGPLTGSACPAASGPDSLRNDAGYSWVASDYRSTLYNHALPPGARPSCIANDGRTAFMGASSGHVRGVNLLRLDGSVTLVVPTIAPKIWREYAAISPPVASASP